MIAINTIVFWFLSNNICIFDSYSTKHTESHEKDSSGTWTLRASHSSPLKYHFERCDQRVDKSTRVEREGEEDTYRALLDIPWYNLSRVWQDATSFLGTAWIWTSCFFRLMMSKVEVKWKFSVLVLVSVPKTQEKDFRPCAQFNSVSSLNSVVTKHTTWRDFKGISSVTGELNFAVVVILRHKSCLFFPLEKWHNKRVVWKTMYPDIFLLSLSLHFTLLTFSWCWFLVFCHGNQETRNYLTTKGSLFQKEKEFWL